MYLFSIYFYKLFIKFNCYRQKKIFKTYSRFLFNMYICFAYWNWSFIFSILKEKDKNRKINECVYLAFIYLLLLIFSTSVLCLYQYLNCHILLLIFCLSFFHHDNLNHQSLVSLYLYNIFQEFQFLFL